MKLETTTAALAAGLCLWMAGCGDGKGTPAGPTVDAAAGGASDAPPDGSSGDVDVRILDWAETQKLVEQHAGKVVVVDLWSTWCPPCMREFPHLVELQRRYPQDVACISVNLNYDGLPSEPPESFRDDVLDFLRQHGAAFDNVICSDPAEDVMDAVQSSIPVVLVYGRGGRLVRQFDNSRMESPEDEFTYEEDVFPLLEELVTGG